MKKLLAYIFITFITILLLSGCEKPQIDVSLPPTPKTLQSTQLPPTRIGTEGEMSMSLNQIYSFESAFENADIVVLVQVQEWIGENTEVHNTYYNAEVLKTYKGSPPSEIVLLQDGDSHRTVMGYPLFTYGNNLFLFLKEAIDIPYENAYWIIGSLTSVMDAVEQPDGSIYLVARSIALCDTLLEERNDPQISDTLASSIYDTMATNDPALEPATPENKSLIFSLKEIEILLEELKQ